jgi:hypothetical protein
MEDIVSQMDSVIATVVKLMNSSEDIHPELYSNEGMKLAVLNEKLGRLKSQAKRDQLVAEKKAYLKARESGMAASPAKDLARLETVDERARYEAIDDEHGDIKRLMDMLRSHISTIKKDI